MSKKRCYQESYIQFGFTFLIDKDGLQKPQCVLCAKVFSNGYMKPSKLKEHLQAVHPNNTKDTEASFKIKKARFETSEQLPNYGFVPEKKPALEASYRVALRIAKDKKPHTIAETLIKPCAMEMVEIMCGKEAKLKISQIPLSNNTIHDRIKDMSEDILKQIVEQIKKSSAKIGLQLDESTDVSNCAQLLVFVRYVNKNDIKEEFLFCEPLTTTTKAVDITSIMNIFFVSNGLSWDLVGAICTDGAPAMLGKNSGFIALVKQVNPNVYSSHCILHRHALATKTLPPYFKNVLDIIVKTVNFIRSRALNHRIFKLLCEAVGSEHTVLLLHTEVRWLSRGKVLSRVFELRSQIETFLRERESTLLHHFTDSTFLLSLAYLADMFSHLNSLNISLQGRGMNILEAEERVTSFQQKLDLYLRRVSNNNYANFSLFDEMVSLQVNPKIDVKVLDCVKMHLENLKITFDGIIPRTFEADNWIRNPFTISLDQISDADDAKDELIELRNNQKIRSDFETMMLDIFWCQQSKPYPILFKRALRALVPFATIYLCESGFSVLVNAEHDMRLALSNTLPRIQQLVDDKQQQRSH